MSSLIKTNNLSRIYHQGSSKINAVQNINLELKFRKPRYSELNMKKKMFTNVKNPITQSLFHYFRDLHTDIIIENNKKNLKYKRDRRLIRGY